jgi:type VI secretion system protein ImpJ
MESLRPIFWGQGMFLQPQHFQQQDYYHDSRLRRYLQLISPFCWGVASMTVNEAALLNFRFEIEQCEVVTWEGTILHFRGESVSGNARLAPRSIENALDPGGKPLGVYLGVKRLQREEANVDLRNGPTWNGAAADQPPRFSIREFTTPDLFAPDGRDVPVQYLCYEGHVLFADEVAHNQDYELVKIAEVMRSAQGQGAFLSKQYIPPCLAVSASPVLEGMLKELRELLTAKGRELSEYKQQHKIHTVNMGSRDTVFLLMMQTVNRYIPLFHHYLEVEQIHPCTLYALLRQLVGELSTFSETISVLGDPRRLPAYRHDQLWACFDPALRLAMELLNELTKGPDYMVPLEFERDYYAATLDKRFFEGNNRYYLAIKVDLPRRELLQLMETGKICSRTEMEYLRTQAVHGLELDYLEIPPEELPRTAHCSYFQINHHSQFWARIQQQQNIAVYCQLPPEKTDMRLLVLFET